MNELQNIFQYEGRQVRTTVVNGEPMFVAKDVCEILEIENHRNVIARLSDGMKGVHSMDTLGGKQEMSVITEAGVYKLVFTSRKPEAEKFTDWVACEVIPSIRKTGSYISVPRSLPEALRLAADLAEKNETLLLENAQSKQIICELQPKASYYDTILQNKSLMPITQIAKDYGMSAIRLNEILHELAVQFKQGDVWLLYQKYASQGYTQSKTHIIDAERSKIHTQWTQKGRLFIYDLLKNKKGILPLIEREKAG